MKQPAFINESIIVKLKTLFEVMDISGEFTYETQLVDLGLDSLQILELVVNIENEFDIAIADEDLDGDNFQSIKTLINLIERYINK
ncbi:acyl carrier protein [Bacillus cereus]|uniref:acyl carrier protein n=1 Tax=Bacillus cereus TaxID=1396 RepID=UPI00123BB382|nr:phosphopantetheine-binding protein [Bacillus cereus]KAA6470414.1 hypothetical protein DX931_28675 [Bacillus cereus]